MLKYCKDNERTKHKKKQQMIKYCCFIWTKEPILERFFSFFFWPKFGTNEDWICQLLIEYVNDKSPVSQEETDSLVLVAGACPPLPPKSYRK